jgi:hypothetical protein
VLAAPDVATFGWLETTNDQTEGNREARFDGVTSSADCISRIGDGSLRKLQAAHRLSAAGLGSVSE